MRTYHRYLWYLCSIVLELLGIKNNFELTDLFTIDGKIDKSFKPGNMRHKIHPNCSIPNRYKQGNN